MLEAVDLEQDEAEGIAGRVGEQPVEPLLEGAPVREPCDGALELRERRALDAVRGGPGLEHRRHDLAIVGAGQCDDSDVREGAPDRTRRLDAVEHGHADVHEDDVRGEREREIDRFPAVGGLADDRDAGLLGEGGPNHEAERIRIVTDEQADHAK